MRPELPIVVPALFAAAMAFPAQSQDVSAEQLTRMLNGPPARPQAQAPANTAQQPTTATQARPAPQTAPQPTSQAVASTPAPAREAERPVSRTAPAAPATPAATAGRQADAVSRGPTALSAQAIAALPFRLELNGAEIIERPAGAGAKVYSVRQGEDYLLMIYTGPQSQYPIYEGEQASVAGRVSTIVLQEGKRVAAEHLFRREDVQPTDIHVWLMLTDGPKAALAERIGQSVDPR